MQYWAFVANPLRYDIDQRLNVSNRDTWTVKDKGVKAGDEVALWRSAAGNPARRGFIALGKVLTDPEVIPPAEDSTAHIIDPDLHDNARRVWVEWKRCNVLECEERSLFLSGLNVARARGGSLFKLSEQEFKRIQELANAS